MVLHVRYTAKAGGVRTKAELRAALGAVPLTSLPGDRGLVRRASARHEFAAERYRLFNAPAADGKRALTLPLDPSRFPFAFRDNLGEITRFDVLVRTKPGADGAPAVTGADLKLELTPDSGTTPVTLTVEPAPGLPDGWLRAFTTKANEFKE